MTIKWIKNALALEVSLVLSVLLASAAVAAPMSNDPNYTARMLASGLRGPANGVVYRLAINDVLVSEYGGDVVTKVDAASGATSFFAAVPSPDEVAMDSTGNVYVKHEPGGPVWRFTGLGTALMPQTFSAPCSLPTGTAFDAANNFYLACNDTGTIYRYATGTTSSPTVFASGFPTLEGMDFSPAGQLFVTDFGNGRIFQVTPGGTTLSAHTQWASGLERPLNVAFEPLTGNMFASSTHRVVRITAPNTVMTFASGFTETYDLDFDPFGCLYVDDFALGELWQFCPARCKPGEEDRGSGEVEDERGGNGGDFEFEECDDDHQFGHRDEDRDVDFHSTHKDRGIKFDLDAPKATTTGAGLNNGKRVTYELVVADFGSGPGTDSYSLDLWDESGALIYSRTGVLRSGNIFVRR